MHENIACIATSCMVVPNLFLACGSKKWSSVYVQTPRDRLHTSNQDSLEEEILYLSGTFLSK